MMSAISKSPVCQTLLPVFVPLPVVVLNEAMTPPVSSISLSATLSPLSASVGSPPVPCQ
jgi:hypothetical protein